MSQDISLEEVIRAIVSQAGLSREDIRKKIDATIASFDGLLTEVGAALIIGDKLGVKVQAHQPEPGSAGDATGSESPSKIKDIIERTKQENGMKNINLYGRVVAITQPHEFLKADGRKGAVASIILRDATGQVRVSCWDEKTKLIDEIVKQGEIIGVYNAYSKVGKTGDVEVHIDKRGMFKPKPDGVDEASFPAADATPAVPAAQASGCIAIAAASESATFVGLVVKVMEKLPPRAFQKKDGTEGWIARVRVADESGSGFVVFWGDRMNDYNDLVAGEVYQFDVLAV
ncbi:MAG: hypothetical protein GYA24_19750, partial [Candidatus Lokiarchaeota archaeon]|nr:hypothetical protein [Candidatus Lokiarchaeota archaeon]